MNSGLNLTCIFTIFCFLQVYCKHNSSLNLLEPIETKIQTHTLQVLYNLMNQDKLFVSNSSIFLPAVSKQTHLNLVKRYEHLPKYGLSDIYIINQTFSNFAKPRSHEFFQHNKDEIRQYFKRKFLEYGLITIRQNFTAKNKLSGQNIIGIKPGIKRGSKFEEEIVLLGAHYDTVKESPGVDDNGSGCVALLELARMLKHYPVRLKHTIIFVAFDLEENGLLGSIAFVREYLFPKEILKNGAIFLGAYILDMIADYDSTPGSQLINSSFSKGIRKSTAQIEKNENRGDFLAMWSRENVDTEVANSLASSWSLSSNSKKYKLISFEPPLPEKEPNDNHYSIYSTYFRSDHASFWYSQGFESLNAVLLTDMGPWRGYQSKCYHSPCDNRSQLTRENLLFVKHIIETVFKVLTINPPQKTSKVLWPKQIQSQSQSQSQSDQRYSDSDYSWQQDKIDQRFSIRGKLWPKDHLINKSKFYFKLGHDRFHRN